VKVTITDIRKAGYCVSGAKEWFERHNLDFRDHVKNGTDAEILLATGDALAVRVIELKKAREDG